MIADITVAMGGRVAEELVFGYDKVTSDASSDIRQASDLSHAMTRKESSPSYLIRRNLQCLAKLQKRLLSKTAELEEKKPPVGLSYEKTIEWLVRQKLALKNNKKTSLLTELNRINEALKEIKGKYEMRDNESASEEGQKKSLEELIEKLITTSKPPTLSPVEFNSNPRMWSQFISQFEESIHKRTDLTPIQKFIHLLINASEKAVGLAAYARRSSSTTCKSQLIY
ncbi:hypothetical protein X798_05504 [Onchocerca flexuosa]|uniref:Peptidase M41 domain-containing protein n=1 Tax=Onchocerca flexuosa TaxID=387005 RepID=A0A238BS55_9BILA|nr:hypothetical protein X798_05504 [Onchocerca flexuosa]